MEKSSKDFSIQDITVTERGKTILLNELQDLTRFQRVTVKVKVIQVDKPIKVANGKTKQDIAVGDTTATAGLTVWESDIGSLEENTSYQLQGMMVQEYRGTKFLSTSKQNCHITKIDDVSTVAEDTEQHKVPAHHTSRMLVS